jgi:hypothetical protein
MTPTLRFKMTGFTLDPRDVAEFGRVAREKRQSKSALLRLLIHDFLKQEARIARQDRREAAA